MKNNPFIITPDMSKKYFCDRSNEAELLMSAFYKKQNSFIFSVKGLGKTTLLKYLNKAINKNKDIVSYYLNVGKITDYKGFYSILLKTLADKKDNQYPAEISNEIEFLPALNTIINKYNRQNCLVILDDFQQILQNVNSEILRKFLSDAEKYNNVRFIFSGNERELVAFVFQMKIENNSNLTFLKLNEIDPKVYKNFIKKMFNKSGIKITKGSIKHIQKLTRNHTYYTQYFCSRLFDLRIKEITLKDINNLFNKILLENEHHFLIYKDLLSSYQWKLVESIAKEGIARQITSGEFIQKYSLNAPSSVKTAENSLLKKNIILKNKTGYQLTDVFFQKWMLLSHC